MAKYTCRVEGDKALYPVLLSNGNLVEEGNLEGGKHYAVWEDPHKKPCYLFALVAGQLQSRDDLFVTRSGRKDEDVFGLEYDLDLSNIVVVADFDGAMENKSLNIYNSEFSLVSPKTASDAEYARIQGVIAHEYFHNWTGNRVTCRDWFQLTLKEGLTVFRDQEFSSDMGSRSVNRIEDVSLLRKNQFPEDAGPMAHPVRPHSYIKMDNFYTSTVYRKGTQVVRMYKTLLGSQGFRRGMDLYFKRHDGQAVTCEDFYAAMRDANDADFANFLLWYSQAGTPTVKVTSFYNSEAKTYSLKFSQEVPPTPGQAVKEPMLIPVAVGLLVSNGKDMPLTSVYCDSVLQVVSADGQPAYTTVLRITKKEEEFVFSEISECPVPSLLRGYSAPVRLESDLTDIDLFFLLAHDSDEFNRWEAGQVLARKLMLSLVADFQQNKPLALKADFVHGFRSILTDYTLDKEFIAKAIDLPGVGEDMDMMDIVDPDAVHAVRSFIRKHLASELKADFLKMDAQITELALGEYKTATNMTDQFAALTALVQHPASADIPGNVENVCKLLKHPAFDLRNSNKVCSLVGGFCTSPVNFHAKDGSGYKFLGEIVLQLDIRNPQGASLMVSALSRWRRYDETRQAHAKAQLEMILSTNGLSENVFEIASKSLVKGMDNSSRSQEVVNFEMEDDIKGCDFVQELVFKKMIERKEHLARIIDRKVNVLTHEHGVSTVKRVKVSVIPIMMVP
ncbi:hypothetical protein C5167_018038 [Papaver somniferum]|uniref:Peptidase M1 leukotriene A4 hydrolase/aminopeptidase C-terminal domain-containing protein n=1 Tax=Papaver somniferum TaxID=3469 RepID=A0A4Y7ILM4_PAPSO|nr:hypothetical protein C5167_018038 [Papaver somniferum]